MPAPLGDTGTRCHRFARGLLSLPMDLSHALQHASTQKLGALVTLKQDGRPQLSNVMYSFDTGLLRISVTADRAKTANLRRDPRASLYVSRPDGWAYIVLEGDAELSAVAASIDDAVVGELVEMYRTLQGEHPDWEEFRRAMVDEHRLVVRLRPNRAYGVWPQG